MRGDLSQQWSDVTGIGAFQIQETLNRMDSNALKVNLDASQNLGEFCLQRITW